VLSAACLVLGQYPRQCARRARAQNEEPRSPRGGAAGGHLAGALGESLRSRWTGLRDSLTKTTRELKGRLSGGGGRSLFPSASLDARSPPTSPGGAQLASPPGARRHHSTAT